MYNKCHKAKHQNPIAKDMAQNRADVATGEAKQAETKHDEIHPIDEDEDDPNVLVDIFKWNKATHAKSYE